MAWFKKERGDISGKVKVPEGLWVKCDICKEIVYRREVDRNLKVCPKCNYHFRISARERILLLVDNNSFSEIGENLLSEDPLGFKDQKSYRDRLKESRQRVNINEAIVAGSTSIGGTPLILTALDFFFMGGSMGSVVGEKFTLAAEKAIEGNLPFIAIISSGGARMQEGILSLMQMAKTSAAIAKFKEGSMPYITILADPTFGGVTASFATLGDVIIAEPKSLIGFAGPRVIEQTIKQKLPDNFQRAEFLMEHGMIDIIVNRKKLKETVIKLLATMIGEKSPGSEK